MTSSDDRDDPSRPDPPTGPRLPHDVEAAWRDIVDHYGERATLGEPSGRAEDPETGRVHPPAAPSVDPSLFDTPHRDADPTTDPGSERGRPSSEAARGADGEHFVPPEPPPVPGTTPARRLAWSGLFGPPLLMLLAVALGWTVPSWLAALLVTGFLGGFVFLVATMPRERGDDGDDGAVV